MEYRAWSWDEHSQAGVIDPAVRVIMDGAVNVMGGAMLCSIDDTVNANSGNMC